jgi:hypothetical protein
MSPVEPNKQLDRIEASLNQIAESLLYIENAVYIGASPAGFIEALSGHPRSHPLVGQKILARAKLVAEILER